MQDNWIKKLVENRFFGKIRNGNITYTVETLPCTALFDVQGTDFFRNMIPKMSLAVSGNCDPRYLDEQSIPYHRTVSFRCRDRELNNFLAVLHCRVLLYARWLISICRRNRLSAFAVGDRSTAKVD